jgi:hypothetical protein
VTDATPDRGPGPAPGSTPAVPPAERGAGPTGPGAPASPRGPALLAELGGPRGLLETTLPLLVFVVVNSAVGLTWAIWTALATGVAIAAVRLVRRKPAVQAIGGLLAVGVAAFIAWRTGSAKGYFLFGIWTQLLYGAVFAGSMLLRWPLVGVLWESLVLGHDARWRRIRPLLRRYQWATLVWVVVFVGRFLVQRFLYDQDALGWLAAVKIVMGYPVFLIGLVVTALIVLDPSLWRSGTLRERIDRVRVSLSPPPDGPPETAAGR